MKSLYTSFFVTLLSANLNAQVAFDLPMAMPEYGTREDLEWMDLSSASMPISGTDVVWDLSGTLSLTGFMRTIVVAPPSSTPGAALFPASTVAFAHVIPPLGTNWFYYRLTDDTLFQEGVRFSDGMQFSCATPKLHLFFPFNLGDAAECDILCGYDGDFTIPTNMGRRAVATGTILHSGGSITNVVMIEELIDEVPTGNYYWYSQDDCLSTYGQYNPAENLVALYLPSGPNAIGETSAPVQTRVYPQPAASEVFVEVGDIAGTLSFALSDAAGRTLQSGPLTAIAGRVRLDVSDLASGNYALRLNDGTAGFARVSVAR